MYVRNARKNIYPLLSEIQVAKTSRPIMKLPGQLQVRTSWGFFGIGRESGDFVERK